MLKLLIKNYSGYSDLIRSTFYTENTSHKLLCKPKGWVATEYKNNIFYEVDCSNCEAVFFGASKWSLKLVSAIFWKLKIHQV